MTSTLKVGDTIFQENGWNGNRDRKVLYPSYKIVGETRISWILDNGERPKKATLEAPHPGYSPSRYVVAEERDRRIYIGRHRLDLSRKVANCKDVEVLKEIAAIFDRIRGLKPSHVFVDELDRIEGELEDRSRE